MSASRRNRHCVPNCSASTARRIPVRRSTMVRQKNLPSRKSRAKHPTGAKDHVFTLEVFLQSGPVTRKFVKKTPVVSRTFEVRGDQTLKDLHDAIFDAFDRKEEHMYEF